MLLFKVVWYFISGIFRVVLLGYLVVVAADESTPVEIARAYVAEMTIGEIARGINHELINLKESVERDADGKIVTLLEQLKDRSKT